MTLSLDIADLERLYAVGEATPENIVREVYARIRARGVRPRLDHARRGGCGYRQGAHRAARARFTASPSR